MKIKKFTEALETGCQTPAVESNLHNITEIVLSKYFYKNGTS